MSVDQKFGNSGWNYVKDKEEVGGKWRRRARVILDSLSSII